MRNQRFKKKRRVREEEEEEEEQLRLNRYDRCDDMSVPSESDDYEDGDYHSGMEDHDAYGDSSDSDDYVAPKKKKIIYVGKDGKQKYSKYSKYSQEGDDGDDDEAEVDYDNETSSGDEDYSKYLGPDIDDDSDDDFFDDENDDNGLVPEEIESDDDFPSSTSPWKKKPLSINKQGGKLPDGLDMSKTGWVLDSEGDRYLLKLSNGKIFEVERKIFDGLYGYQRSGVEWLASRYADDELSGGILADDMGLGKSVQIATFINGLARSDIAFTFIILSPVSVLTNWEKELKKWAPNVSVVKFHNITNSHKRKSVITQFANPKNTHGRVLLTTYATMRTQINSLVKRFGEGSGVNCIILDEGHSIKNKKSQISNVMRLLPAKCKFVLSGTPIMNRLSELYALYDYIFNGELLGEESEFKRTYEIPITASTKRYASTQVKILGNELSVQLREQCQKYMLRRDKMEVLKTVDATKEGKDASTSVRATISQKNDLVIYCKMGKKQEEVYRRFIASREVKAALSNDKYTRVGTNPLQLLNILKILCNHHIISTKYGNMPPANIDGVKDQALIARLIREHEDRMIQKRIQEASLETLSDSGKVKVMKKILVENKKNKNRTLIFSQYKRMINLVERVIQEDLRLKYLRIDGSTSASERGILVDKFNRDSVYDCMLLTTQCGSVGLTLTGADRVIILDPNWNPAIDNQAVDRAYRIGQQRNVVIYRLINCSSIEEKIYRKQIFKSNLSKTAIEKENNYRYFSDAELHELFTLDDTQSSKTQKQLYELHDADRKTYPQLEKHLKFLRSIDEVYGYSHHDLLFGKEADDDEEQEEIARQLNVTIESNSRDRVLTDMLEQLNQQKEQAIVIDE